MGRAGTESEVPVYDIQLSEELFANKVVKKREDNHLLG